MTKELSKITKQLLEQVSEIIKNYDKLYRENELKYNIFEVLRISKREVYICRVIADLLNPKGRHCQGDIFLRQFWNIISPKIDNCPELDTKNTQIITEYNIDENRRIDIVIDDGSIFIPIEVKIGADEEGKQIADYAEYSRKKNKNKPIPVIYLTPMGDKPNTANSDNDYICISFRNEILEWLNECLSRSDIELAISVKEILKQLIDAVKSYSEDYEMKKEIDGLITQSKETIRAARAISKAVKVFDGGLYNKLYDIFHHTILKYVQQELPSARFYDNDDNAKKDEDKWYAINVPIKNNKYLLLIHYVWNKIGIYSEDGVNPTSKEANNIAKRMSDLEKDVGDEFTNIDKKGWENCIWLNEELHYPELADVEDELYVYELYKQYEQHPQEVAKRIIDIARNLENV